MDSLPQLDVPAKKGRGGKRPGAGRKRKPKQQLLSVELANRLLQIRLNKWKITPTDFNRQLEDQKGRCALCEELLTDGWVIDHDHMTLQIRGLLHSRCNMMIGLAKDDPLKLEKAIAYLKRHNKYLS